MVDFGLVDQAMCLAKVAHADIKRFSGEPYVNHLHRVAGRVAPYFPTTDALVLAYLHDICEDTPTTIAMIQEQFGMPIARGVFVLSQGEGEPRDSYLERVLASDPTVVAVKFADRCDNMQGLAKLATDHPEKYREHARRYVEEVDRYFLPNSAGAPSDLVLELQRACYETKRIFHV